MVMKCNFPAIAHVIREWRPREPSNRARRGPTDNNAKVAAAGDSNSRNEPLATLHSTSGRNLAPDGCHRAVGARGFPLSAARGLAAGGLSNDSGADALSGRKPR